MSSKPAMLAIIGGGNMARAIISGACKSRLIAHNEIIVVEPDPRQREDLKHWGVEATTDHHAAISRLKAPATHAPDDDLGPWKFGGQVLLAVKPQVLPDAAKQIRPAMEETPRVVISILAGTPTAKIAALLGPQHPVVRVMPNTPARIGKGMAAITAGQNALPAHLELAEALFMGLGEVVKIDESLMDAFTAVAGSGPAYVFFLAEIMLRAARDLGFDRITADRIVRQTVMGSAALLSESTEPPEALRAQVTSKGGTTEAALRVLEQRQVIDAFTAALTAARDRGRELSK